MVMLHILSIKFYGDGAPAAVGIRLGVVAESVEVSQVVPDRSEGVMFVLPVAREIGLAAGGFAHSLEHGGGDGFLLRLPGADHVNDRSG